MRRAVLAVLVVLALAACPGAPASRDEVVTRAAAFASYAWHLGEANVDSPCFPGYSSPLPIGDYRGLPYAFGGEMSLWTFQQRLEAGDLAGLDGNTGMKASQSQADCAIGLDCSGLVTECWRSPRISTRSVEEVADRLDSVDDLLPGDVLNCNSSSLEHMVLWLERLPDGTPVFYEAVQPGVFRNDFAGWSWLTNFGGVDCGGGDDRFVPMRYRAITDSSGERRKGTPDQPIEVRAFPFTHDGDTSTSPSDELDAYAQAPDLDGPEVVYRLHLSQPGALHATLQASAGAELALVLLKSLNLGDDLGVDSAVLDVANLDCGDYYLVVDTRGGATAASPKPGAYGMDVSFTPSGAACGAPAGLNFTQGPGSACDYSDAAWASNVYSTCAPSLGAPACVQYEPRAGLCSKACSSNGECQGIFPGGCCADVRALGYWYWDWVRDPSRVDFCLPAERCGVAVDAGVPASAPGGGQSGCATLGAGGRRSEHVVTGAAFLVFALWSDRRRRAGTAKRVGWSGRSSLPSRVAGPHE